jgi:molybdopterin biosynthesis enzyme MoaB
MNSNSDTTTSMTEIVDDESTSIDEDMRDVDYQQSRTHLSRSGTGSTSSNGTPTTTHNGIKRQKEISPCYVCGAKAHGYNFDQSNK